MHDALAVATLDKRVTFICNKCFTATEKCTTTPNQGCGEPVHVFRSINPTVGPRLSLGLGLRQGFDRVNLIQFLDICVSVRLLKEDMSPL